jgi:hypothetical protein
VEGGEKGWIFKRRAPLGKADDVGGQGIVIVEEEAPLYRRGMVKIGDTCEREQRL